jgi:cephalosporin hydroxylase
MRSNAARRAATWAFTITYYAEPARTWQNTRWLGVRTAKLPSDLWIYQEILHEVRPDVIIEAGTNRGGSALYLATICDALNHGRIITIDIEEFLDRPEHQRIEYLTGSSVAPEIIEKVTAAADGTVMVILDSDHSRDHVLAELRAYAPLVTPGSYLVVEDTVVGHPVARAGVPGPMEAVDVFLPEAPEFVSDRSREKFLHTWNARGFLRRAQDVAPSGAG